MVIQRSPAQQAVWRHLLVLGFLLEGAVGSASVGPLA